MIELIKVTAKTPCGDTKEYVFMGNLDEPADQTRLVEFMVKCCDDTADFFSCPDDWDPISWRDSTCAKWEDPEGKRSDFGILPFGNPFVR